LCATQLPNFGEPTAYLVHLLPGPNLGLMRELVVI
jgi:hypothetical protein